MSLTLGGLAALAGIQGASNLLTNAQQNKYQKQADQRANNYNLAMWNMQNEYNTPANQMKRYAEAGLNPFLIYGQGNAGNASSPPSAQVTPKQAARIDLMSMVSSALQMQSYMKDIELKDAQVRNVESKTQTDGAKRAELFIDSVRKGQALQARLKAAVARGELTYQQVARLRQQMMYEPLEYALKEKALQLRSDPLSGAPYYIRAPFGYVRDFLRNSVDMPSDAEIKSYLETGNYRGSQPSSVGIWSYR